jgi:hypothetical protein
MINLNEYLLDIENGDWGCGCCASGTAEENRKYIMEVLERLVKEVQDSTDHSAGQ